MTTDRLYYRDSSVTSFDAVVRSCEAVDGAWRVVLDRTAFYPSSGGQPFDTGRLGAAEVVEVAEDDDGRVAHRVTRPLESGTRVRGEIDWARRLDHMQQHTGQHLLSAAFDRLAGVRTESFHMGAAVSTIDLAREVTAPEIAAAETEGNRVVWEDRPVQIRFEDADSAGRLALRKASSRTGTLRLVEIPDVDVSACGGTHVPSTGVVGLIAVTAWERFKGGTRLTFVCGGRALASHRRLRDEMARLSRLFSVGSHEVGDAAERLQRENRDLSRTVREQTDALAYARAVEWLSGAETIRGLRGVLRAEPAGTEFLKKAAQALVAAPDVVAVLVGHGDPTPIVIARSSGVALDAGSLIRQITAELGGRGGGRPELAQGGVTAAPRQILDVVRARLGS